MEDEYKCGGYIGDPPPYYGHVDDSIEVKYFVKALETRLKYCPDQVVNIIVSAESARRILNALKEQEAIKPVITPWKTDDDGNVIIAKRECGRCGCQFFTEKPNFCENCGTPISWEWR